MGTTPLGQDQGLGSATGYVAKSLTKPFRVKDLVSLNQKSLDPEISKIILSKIILSKIILSKIILSKIILSKIILSKIILSKIILSKTLKHGFVKLFAT
jgi:hypothetical protein